MDLISALILSLFIFIALFTLSYAGVGTTWYSAVIFSVTVTLLLLSLLYPASQITSEESRFAVATYMLCYGLGSFFILLYVLLISVTDYRCVGESCGTNTTFFQKIDCFGSSLTTA